MSHIEYVPPEDIKYLTLEEDKRYALQLELKVPDKDFPQVTTQNTVVYDKLKNFFIRTNGLEEGRKLIKYFNDNLFAVTPNNITHSYVTDDCGNEYRIMEINYGDWSDAPVMKILKVKRGQNVC